MNSIWQKMRQFWDELDPFWQKFFVVVVVIVGLYYIMSPYQNCMRGGAGSGWCMRFTSW